MELKLTEGPLTDTDNVEQHKTPCNTPFCNVQNENLQTMRNVSWLTWASFLSGECSATAIPGAAAATLPLRKSQARHVSDRFHVTQRFSESRGVCCCRSCRCVSLESPRRFDSHQRFLPHSRTVGYKEWRGRTAFLLSEVWKCLKYSRCKKQRKTRLSSLWRSSQLFCQQMSFSKLSQNFMLMLEVACSKP